MGKMSQAIIPAFLLRFSIDGFLFPVLIAVLTGAEGEVHRA
jgi:hypothetical protein